MDSLISLLQIVNTLSPLAVIALLALVIYIMVWKQPSRADLDLVKENHLHELPAMAATLRQVAETLQRIEVSMGENFSYIRARLNGGK